MKNNLKILYSLSIIILVFIIVCLLLGFNNISKFFTTHFLLISSLASIATCIGLIYTIYYNNKNHSKELENTRIAANQLEFEKKLYDILCIYDSLISDLLLNIILFDNNSISMRVDTLLSMSEISTKYIYVLNNIHDKIYFFYREVKADHPELDKLIKDIEGVNKSITVELNHYSELCTEGLKINNRYLNIPKVTEKALDKKSLDEFNNDVTEIINNKNKILKSIINIISEKKSIIYQEAASCIEERASIIRNKK